jgi:hypothetical protein
MVRIIHKEKNIIHFFIILDIFLNSVYSYTRMYALNYFSNVNMISHVLLGYIPINNFNYTISLSCQKYPSFHIFDVSYIDAYYACIVFIKYSVSIYK